MITQEKLKEFKDNPIVVDFSSTGQKVAFCKQADSVENGFWNKDCKEWSGFDLPEFCVSIVDTEEYIGEIHGDPDPDILEPIEDLLEDLFKDMIDAELIETHVMELCHDIDMNKCDSNDPEEIWEIICDRMTRSGAKLFDPEYLGG